MHSKEQYTLVWESKHLKRLGNVLLHRQKELRKFFFEKSSNVGVETAHKIIERAGTGKY